MRLTNVMAMSLDGAIASSARETDSERGLVGITSPADQAHLHRLISDADAIIVGARSVIASGGILNVKRADGSYPYWAVLSRAGVAEDETFLGQTDIPRCLVLGPTASPPEARVNLTVLSSTEGESAHTTLQHLSSLGCKNVLLFGGSEINKIFYDLGLVDRLILTISPVILGRLGSVPIVTPPLAKPIKLQPVASQLQENLVFLTYDVVKI